jgi:hypothetical protein
VYVVNAVDNSSFNRLASRIADSDKGQALLSDARRSGHGIFFWGGGGGCRISNFGGHRCCYSTSSPKQLSHYESSNSTIRTAAYPRFNFLCVVRFDWRHVTKIKWRHFVHRMD